MELKLYLYPSMIKILNEQGKIQDGKVFTYKGWVEVVEIQKL